MPLADKIEQSARCGDENINAFSQLTHLLVLRYAAKNGSVGKVKVLAIVFKALFDLDG